MSGSKSAIDGQLTSPYQIVAELIAGHDFGGQQRRGHVRQLVEAVGSV
jgi:hypothetical protein